MIVRRDDIIVSTTRPTRKAIALITSEQDGCIASTGFAVLREIKNHNIQRGYLFVMLRHSLTTRQFEQRSSGGSYPAITIEELKQVFIPLPPLAVQERIATEALARRERAEALEQEAASILATAKAEVERMILGEDT
jgi:restriction endonuclease S subunit